MTQDKLPTIIERIQETIRYFDDEFSTEIVSDSEKLYHHLKVWKSPVSSHAGGVTPNDLLDVLHVLNQSQPAIDEAELANLVAKEIWTQHRGGLPSVYDNLNAWHLDKEACLQQAGVAIKSLRALGVLHNVKWENGND